MDVRGEKTVRKKRKEQAKPSQAGRENGVPVAIRRGR